MLWLCICLPRLPLEALQPEESEIPAAVTVCEGSTRWVIGCNAAAERAHLKAPMNCAVALAIHPQLQILNRKIRAEHTALERLAAWAYQFSGSVILGEVREELRLAHTACLWLEIEASLRLFGGLRTLIQSIEKELGQLGYSYQLGIGPTLEGAALLARAGIRMAVTSSHALFMRIRSLPLNLLMLPLEIARDLHIAGIRTPGLLLELPREQLSKRFGPQISQYLDRLMGVAPDPRIAFRLPDAYAAHFEFEFDVRNTEALLFPLQRMLREFAGYLRGRDTGVQRFRIIFGHRTVPATEIRIGSSAPDRNAERFLTLVRERMQSVILPAPTTSLSIDADEFSAPEALQNDLLNRSRLQTEEFSHTIDRISMRIGEENVHYVCTAAEHRPEKSWIPTELPRKSAALQFSDRPLWLLPQPRSLESSSLPGMTSAPERIESGWWDDGEVQRDYYVVHMREGPDLWVFQDLRTSGWYLHGFWS